MSNDQNLQDEILEKKISETEQASHWSSDDEKGNQGLSIPEPIDQDPQKVQQLLLQKLQSKWRWVDTILDNIIHIAENAAMSTSDGTIIADYKRRLDAVKLISEMTWLYQKKWNAISLKFDLARAIRN